jgi:hypothetical protein
MMLSRIIGERYGFLSFDLTGTRIKQNFYHPQQGFFIVGGIGKIATVKYEFCRLDQLPDGQPRINNVEKNSSN